MTAENHDARPGDRRVSEGGEIHGCLLDIRCKHCLEQLKPIDPSECRVCRGDLSEPRAHHRCPCGKAWLCLSVRFMQPFS